MPWPMPNQEGAFVAEIADHLLDRDDRQGGAGAKAGGGQPGAEAAPVGKPFQRIADAGAVDRAGADPADRGGDVEEYERVGKGVHDPGDADEDTADQDDDLGAEAAAKPPLDRYQPGFGIDVD